MKKSHHHSIGEIITLDLLIKGERARVHSIHTTNHVFRRRLMDMGITEGVQIIIKKIAPLGDPIDIQLRGYELCLRKRDLAMIEVEVIK